MRQGDRIRIRVENGLPEETTVHWHGLRIEQSMDGMPDTPLPPIGPGESFVYDFVPPDAGTYWFHPHVGMQLDRGLYGALIVEPRNETLSYDREAVARPRRLARRGRRHTRREPSTACSPRGCRCPG